jgi:glycosyltransferase involved in cell wall biosynthesis
MNKIPISVIVVTKNEEERIERCLSALSLFDEVWVLDSGSSDRTQEIAHAAGAKVHDFKWNGIYPKKRQWALGRLELKYDRILFVDADEIVTPQLCSEIAALDWRCAGYFIKGLYTFQGRLLQHGLCNNKLVLFDRKKVCFPVIDDLDIEGMGEMEGHYQPVLKDGFAGEKIGQLRAPMIHEAYEDAAAWEARHWRYARWECGMNAKGAWPQDPDPWRAVLKRLFRALPFRGALAFLQSYIFMLGFLDGPEGYAFAKTRQRYYRMIAYQRDFKDQ